MNDQTEDHTPSTYVCRCEEVTNEQLEAAIDAGASSLNDLKRRTRAGMGLCQGAFCLGEMASILAGRLDCELGEIAPMTFRPPVGGITVDALSRSDDRT